MGFFKETVLLAFTFLVEPYSFDCTQANETAVQYDSDFLSIAVCYDPYSAEVSLTFSRPRHDECPYSLAELMELYGAEFEWGGTFAQASTPQALQKVLHTFATALIHCGAALLNGDQETFKLLDGKRRQSLVRATMDEARRNADTAWRERDYPELVRILKPIQAQLSLHEAGRLEYALKRVHCTTPME